MTLRTALPLTALVALCGVACGPPDKDPPGTTCTGVDAGDLVITELMVDPPGVDTGQEWIEVYNTTSQPIQLAGLTLYAARLDGSQMKQLRLTTGSIAPDTYYVFGDVREGPNPEWVNQSYGNRLGALGNTSGLVGIKCGTKLVDEVKWTKKPAAGESISFNGALKPDSAENDVEDNWCAPVEEYAEGAFGTPGKPNNVCADDPSNLTGCLDGGTERDLVNPAPGDLFITEFMANPKAVGDSHGEWIEVYATRDIDLNGVTLVNEGGRKTTFGGADCLRIAEGEHKVLARIADPALNGGLENVFAMFSVSLGNSGTRWIELVFGETLLDKVTYSSVGDGISTQLAPEKYDPTANDDEENWCRTPETATYGLGDRGTPGLPNASCDPVVAPTGCIDPSTNELRDVRSPLPGDLLITELMPSSGAVADADGEWFEVYTWEDVDLNGVVLANEGTGKTTLESDTCLEAFAGEHLVFARKSDPEVNGGLPEVFETFNFNLANSGSRAVELRLGEDVLARAAYESTTKGKSLQLDASSYDLPDEQRAAAWCTTPDEVTFGKGDLGTPGAQNVDCPVPPEEIEGCEDPVTGEARDPVSPGEGELVITELLADPGKTTDANGEWFEIVATKAVDLNDVEVQYDANTPLKLTARECLRVEAGEHLVFARRADPDVNGGVEGVFETFTFQLGNTGEHTLKVTHDEVVVDTVTWTDATEGVALQLDKTLYDAELNDEAEAWCLATEPFGAGDLGTPGAENGECGTEP